MQITLLRTDKSKTETRGVLGYGNQVFGYTIEHPVIGAQNSEVVPAIKEGIYDIEVRGNPSSGTPSIKLKGKYIPSNIAIRCCKPFGNSNSSITLVSSPDSEGGTRPVDYKAWLSLLDFISKQEEEVMLEIK